MASIFQKQKDVLLSELRTFVVTKAQPDQDKNISCFEKKIECQVKTFS
jgi:hypothetical protein